MSDAIKFPKTPRLTQVMREVEPPEWKGARAVAEEKADGANVGVFFDGVELRLQSRGHVLRGGGRERQFTAFHGWAASRLESLRETLGDHCVLYGEWCHVMNKSFYNALPDWLLGFDVLDRESGEFLGVDERDRFFRACSVEPVARLWDGAYRKAPAFGGLLGPSRYKTAGWREALEAEACRVGLRDAWAETDNSDAMEGVYVRLEVSGRVVGRMKLHRPGYEKVRTDTWRERPLVHNRLGSE
jgi:hypothetical protein